MLTSQKQFAHSYAERLIQLIRNLGVTDIYLDKIVDNVSQSCDICKRFSNPHLGLPLDLVRK